MAAYLKSKKGNFFCYLDSIWASQPNANKTVNIFFKFEEGYYIHVDFKLGEKVDKYTHTQKWWWVKWEKIAQSLHFVVDKVLQ